MRQKKKWARLNKMEIMAHVNIKKYHNQYSFILLLKAYKNNQRDIMYIYIYILYINHLCSCAVEITQ